MDVYISTSMGVSTFVESFTLITEEPPRKYYKLVCYLKYQ